MNNTQRRKRNLKSVVTEIVDKKRKRHQTIIHPNKETNVTVVSHEVEKALSIDHILDGILSNVRITDLLKIRCSCRRWNEFALQKLKSRISFFFQNLKLRWHKKPRNLNNLVNLIQTTSTFPCSKFYFFMTSSKLCNEHLFTSSLKEFLIIQGAHLRVLSLCYCNYRAYQEKKLSEFQLINQVHNLLDLTPNLHSLTLNVNFKTLSNQDSETIGTRRLRSSSVNPDGFLLETGTIRNRNVKLRTLSMEYDVSEKLLDVFFSRAPNLKEVYLKEKFNIFLYNPQDRLHLLKKVFFFPNSVQVNELHDKIANDCQIRNLRLRDLHIHMFSVRLNSRYPFLYNPDVEARAIKVLNRVLESSWDSIVRMTLAETVFVQGIKFPPKMPNVKYISIEELMEVNNEEESINDPKFGWLKTFPGLLHLDISLNGNSRMFIKFFKNLNLDPMESVRNVRIWCFEVRNAFKHNKMVQPFFPNANVSIR